MEKNAKVSIVVPVYNCEKYINRCVSSLVNQTWSNIEIILIDDGSNDNSGKICDELKSHDNRIIVIHKENEGLGKTRNKGMQIATGKYIVFVDADDYVDISGIEKMVNIAEEYQVEIVTSEFIYNGKPEKLTIKSGLYQGTEISSLVAYMLGIIADDKKNLNVSSCTKLYLLSFLRKINAEFPSERKLIWEDMAFNVNVILKSTKIYVTDIHYYYYFYNESSLTHKYDCDKFLKLMDMYEYVIEIINKNNLQNDAKRRFNNTIMGNIRTCIKLEVFYRKNIGRKKVINKIKLLCNDIRVQKILTEIVRNDETVQQRIYSVLLKGKNIYGLYILAIIQNMRKHNKIN